MTDRIHSLIVTLEKDIREDDVEALRSAVRQLRGVIWVDGLKSDPTTVMAEQRAKHDLMQKVWDVLK